MARQIDADALKKVLVEEYEAHEHYIGEKMLEAIDNAPTIETKLSKEQIEKITDLLENEWGYEGIREDIERILICNNLQGEYVDISKLRLMTVEECAGHTIDYAMGWKACIDWIKNGGDTKEDRQNDR